MRSRYAWGHPAPRIVNRDDETRGGLQDVSANHRDEVIGAGSDRDTRPISEAGWVLREAPEIDILAREAGRQRNQVSPVPGEFVSDVGPKNA